MPIQTLIIPPRLLLRKMIISQLELGPPVMCFILLLHDLVDEEPANFYREKRRVAFVTGHLFTFLVVLSLICLVTTQILICGNQTI